MAVAFFASAKLIPRVQVNSQSGFRQGTAEVVPGAVKGSLDSRDSVAATLRWAGAQFPWNRQSWLRAYEQVSPQQRPQKLGAPLSKPLRARISQPAAGELIPASRRCGRDYFFGSFFSPQW